MQRWIDFQKKFWHDSRIPLHISLLNINNIEKRKYFNWDSRYLNQIERESNEGLKL